jgi:hypothetical protein
VGFTTKINYKRHKCISYAHQRGVIHRDRGSFAPAVAGLACNDKTLLIELMMNMNMDNVLCCN